MHPSDDGARRLKPAATLTYGIESLNLGSSRYGMTGRYIYRITEKLF